MSQTHNESHADNRRVENPYRADRLRVSLYNLPSLGLLQQCGVQSSETDTVINSIYLLGDVEASGHSPRAQQVTYQTRSGQRFY